MLARILNIFLWKYILFLYQDDYKLSPNNMLISNNLAALKT